MGLNEFSPSDRTLDATLAALADPTRRAILERLKRGEARVTELAEPFEISLAAVSKHIGILERAKLVRRRRVWREHFISFDPTPLIEAAAWMDRQRAFWTERLDVLEQILKAEDAAKSAETPARKHKKTRSKR